LSALPIAHAGHVLIDLAIFLVPLGSLLVTIVVLRLRGPRDR